METIKMPMTRLIPFLAVIALVVGLALLLAAVLPAAPVSASHGNQFAATSLSPSSQSGVVGSSFSVDIVFHDDPGSHAADGIRALVSFNPSILQVTSVTGGGLPFGNVTTNTVNNITGLIEYEAHGAAVNGFTITAATIVFNAIAPGTSVLHLSGVREFIVGFGAFGVDGLAVGGSITVTGPTDTTPPVVTAPALIIVECNSAGGVSTSDPAIQAWLNSSSAVDDVDGSLSVSNDLATGLCAVGSTKTVTFSATDTAGNTGSATSTITVVDSTAPSISSASASPSSLWSPNHKMVPVTVSVNVSDVCDPSVTCSITAVTSNEPQNGLGDGDTAPDWAITGALTLDLRAERSGTGTGQVYTITVTCTDDSGNSSTETVTVTVPKSKGK
jgi:hypothetical protein